MQSTFVYDKPLGYVQITSLAAATALTVPAGASKAIIIVETQNVRWRDDGTNPTTTVGMLAKTTDAPIIYTGNLSLLKFIEVTASASISVSFYG